MAQNGVLKKITFRGTEQKTAVPCGFYECVERGASLLSQHFEGVIFTHGNVAWTVWT